MGPNVSLYDPCRGIMHHNRDDTQAFVYDLIEPRRPLVDAAFLRFLRKQEFTGADFVLRADGVCRVCPQLARSISQIAAGGGNGSGLAVRNEPPPPSH